MLNKQLKFNLDILNDEADYLQYFNNKNKVKKNVLDLFCGCGGLSLGFKRAGFNIVGGIDFDSDSLLTFNKNINSSAFNMNLENKNWINKI